MENTVSILKGEEIYCYQPTASVINVQELVHSMESAIEGGQLYHLIDLGDKLSEAPDLSPVHKLLSTNDELRIVVSGGGKAAQTATLAMNMAWAPTHSEGEDYLMLEKIEQELGAEEDEEEE